MKGEHEAAATRVRTGRPADGEFAVYAQPDIARVRGDDAVEALVAQGRELVALLQPLDEARVRGLTYASGKWTLKEVVGHLADDERIFGYRMLCIARGDDRPLPGFDEKAYMRTSGFEQRALSELLDEYTSVRRSTVTLLDGLPAEAWMRRGEVNGYIATGARARVPCGRSRAASSRVAPAALSPEAPVGRWRQRSRTRSLVRACGPSFAHFRRLDAFGSPAPCSRYFRT